MFLGLSREEKPLHWAETPIAIELYAKRGEFSTSSLSGKGKQHIIYAPETGAHEKLG